MRYGLTGVDVEIDLSRKTIEKVQNDPKLTELYLGGKGTNARILWDRVPPEVEPFSPDNLLIVGTGALTGTIVPSANRATITYLSPIMGIHSYSSLGGYFGPALKHAGYDTVIFSGKSPSPVYLWIDDDRLELRDARHLWGKDTFETQRLLREEMDKDDFEILCIGPAGENRVFTATAESGSGASASRGGVGAIMGDKMLKAIVVRGTKDLNIADPARVAELCGQLLDRSETIREEVFANFGRQNVQGYTRQAGYGNRSGAVFPELKEKIDGVGKMAQEFMEEKTDRRVACYNCPQHCHRAYARSDGGYMVIKCTSWGMGIVATKIFDMDFTLAFYDLVQKYGLDSMALSNQIAFAIDLYERGILTKEDTDGMHLEWGNAEVALSLVDKIAHREGIGDLLADGTYRAAQRIGRGAEYYAYHVKKYDQHPFRREGYLGLSEAINDKADTTKLLGTTPAAIWKRGKDFIDSWGFHYPEDYKRYVQTPPDPTGADYEGTIKYMTYNEEIFNLADLAGLCYFWTGHYEPLPVNSRAFYAELVSAVTGIDIDEAMATEMAKRVVNLVRGYNVRAGLRRKDDMLPDRYFTIPPAPGTYKADKVLFNKWVDEWYKVRGWDGDGIPARETLEGLGLDYVVRDLERRGILARPATALVT